MLAGIVGWHLVRMADLQRFRKSVDLFVTNLQKLQIISLSRRCDVSVKVFKKEGQYFYSMTSDEPLLTRTKDHPILLKGVNGISWKSIKKQSKSEMEFTIASNGHIAPLEVIGFFLKNAQSDCAEGEAIWLDLQNPLQLICRSNP